jgi:hypothetical protein
MLKMRYLLGQTITSSPNNLITLEFTYINEQSCCFLFVNSNFYDGPSMRVTCNAERKKKSLFRNKTQYKQQNIIFPMKECKTSMNMGDSEVQRLRRLTTK